MCRVDHRGVEGAHHLGPARCIVPGREPRRDHELFRDRIVARREDARVAAAQGIAHVRRRHRRRVQTAGDQGGLQLAVLHLDEVDAAGVAAVLVDPGARRERARVRQVAHADGLAVQVAAGCDRRTLGDEQCGRGRPARVDGARRDQHERDASFVRQRRRR